MSRFGSRSRPSTAASLWLNPSPPSVRYQAQIRAPMTGTVTVTADTAANTFGPWSEIIASVGADTSMIGVRVSGIGAAAVNTGSVLSFGLGASGSEVEFAQITVGGAGIEPGLQFQLPIRIASGQRLAARLQSVVTGGKTGVVDVMTFDANPYLYPSTNTAVDTLGITLATSSATTIATNANTYTEIVASTSQTYRGLVVVPSLATNNYPANDSFYSMTVAIGAAGSETDVGAFYMTAGANEAFNSRQPSYFIPVTVLQGSRIAVKKSISRTPVQACVLGIPF